MPSSSTVRVFVIYTYRWAIFVEHEWRKRWRCSRPSEPDRIGITHATSFLSKLYDRHVVQIYGKQFYLVHSFFWSVEFHRIIPLDTVTPKVYSFPLDENLMSRLLAGWFTVISSIRGEILLVVFSTESYQLIINCYDPIFNELNLTVGTSERQEVFAKICCDY